MEHQVCLNGVEWLGGVATGYVTVASLLANFIPEPDKIQNKVLRALSRFVHWSAVDVVTATQPK